MKAAAPGIGVTFARARSRGRNNPPDAQAGRQFAAQYFRTLNEQRLINGLMGDAHGLVVREVDRHRLCRRGGASRSRHCRLSAHRWTQ
jgi:hypothetical protein